MSKLYIPLSSVIQVVISVACLIKTGDFLFSILILTLGTISLFLYGTGITRKLTSRFVKLVHNAAHHMNHVNK